MIRRLTAVAAALALLGGCQTASELLEGKKIDYKSAGQLPPLEIPPDLTSPSRDNRYAVPQAKSATTLSEYQSGRQEQAKAGGSTSVLPAVERMRIERAGTQRWLVVAEPPEKVWQLVRDFWLENGFLIATDNPEAGVMETDWAENRAKIPQDWLRSTLGKLIEQVYSTPERDKFRTRLERTEAGHTEVYISHRGMYEVYTSAQAASTKWQPREPDPNLEAEFLRRLMVRMGTQEERAKQQVASAAAAAAEPSKAALAKGIGGFENLEVFEPFDRAWRRVGLALDRVGFTVEDRDRQKGQYFVRYADPESDMARVDAQKPGLLSKLAFWKPSEPKVKAEQYRVHIRQFAGKCVVQVLTKDGQADGSSSAKRIIALLHEQLK